MASQKKELAILRYNQSVAAGRQSLLRGAGVSDPDGINFSGKTFGDLPTAIQNAVLRFLGCSAD
jgi:hypothetical protein